ncbi:hypothetical protein SAMN06265379_1207 [Saccharicrinis carchari]|uniref:Uncharacterized protein n=1 Tax=Saccharicrinis carchari TaxID=1168039 RepID=A0A521FD85_SACCC|nr:SoxR reducing system RseC family protein [Saccharicrinis carchari]SMO93561.1 hypothetical protein SAMN06265379_1207 [Saccharicrinis carchari]
MIDKVLNFQRIEYRSKMSAQDFKSRLSSIFSQKGFKFNLSGKFTSEQDFKATDKWTIGIYIRSFENDPAYLKGKIKDSKNGVTVEVLVRPNSIFSLFGLLFPLIGMIALVSTNFGKTDEDALGVGIGFIIFGLICYPIGNYLRNRIRNKFEDYLDLARPEKELK